jgi:hypothetical protein
VRVLFVQGTPAPLRPFLVGHEVREAKAQGWDTLANGALLAAAEAAGFEVLVTTDQNMRYQQNLAGRLIAIVVLGKGRWTLIRRRMRQVVIAVNAATPGSYTEVEIRE